MGLLVRVLLVVLALLLFVVGIVTMITPIPFGLFLIVVSFTLLAIAVPGLVRFWRRRWSWLDRLLDRATARLPAWLARQLRRSDPDRSAREASRNTRDQPKNPAIAEDRAALARHILMR